MLKYSDIEHLMRFNSNMVRLKELGQTLKFKRTSVVSIPIWFD